MTFNLGFSYVPGSIRVTLNGQQVAVDETDPDEGAIFVHVPSGDSGEISIDYQRRLVQGGGPKTSRFERAVLRDALLAPRTALKLRTRRPRERPTSLPLLRKSGATTTAVEVPTDDHPTYLALPILDLAAHLRGDPSPNLKVVAPGMKAISVSPVTLQMAAQKLGGDTGVQVSLDIYAFARVLAKIAHGFVAAADLGDVETFLVEPMFADDESIGEWVGGAPEMTLGTEGLHGVRVHVVNRDVHVRIRLFAQLGGPEYLVIAGRLLDAPSSKVPFATVESNKQSRAQPNRALHQTGTAHDL